MSLNIQKTIEKNKQRLAKMNEPYDPITGEGSFSIERVEVFLPDCRVYTTDRGSLFLPREMADHDVIKTYLKMGNVKEFLRSKGIAPTETNVTMFWVEFVNLRIQYDFEFWAATYCFIKDKFSGQDINFVLNRGQRILLKEFERERHTGNGMIRIILLKARQWGGSTFTQMYMGWLQLVIHKQWNSIIAAHIENAARKIRGMYSKLMMKYQYQLIPDAWCQEDILLKPFEGSQTTRWIKPRGCRISVGSANKPDSIRGDDVVMAHLSEVGLWQATEGRKPEDLVQSVIGTIMPIRDSLIVMESTAKGVGNYFHREWLRAVRKESVYTPVFISWFDIEKYQMEIECRDGETQDEAYAAFIRSLTKEEEDLFKLGATLEGIKWYRVQAKAFSDKWRFLSEFPSTPDEAFQSTGNPYFDLDDVHRLKDNTCEPRFVGDLVGMKQVGELECLYRIEWRDNPESNFKVWKKPEEDEKVSERYLVVVDIGGMSERADRSVICVFDRYWMANDGVPEVVAEWCGHTEHYKLAWLAAQIATWYHDALLVIESNTLETHKTEGYHGEYILDEIGRYYRNLYARTSQEEIRQGLPTRWGFQTNRQTKVTVCDHQKKVLQRDMYIEHCDEAVFEHQTLELKEDGTIGAREGCHDDRFITRAIGNYICWEKMELPTKLYSGSNGVYEGSGFMSNI